MDELQLTPEDAERLVAMRGLHDTMSGELKSELLSTPVPTELSRYWERLRRSAARVFSGKSMKPPKSVPHSQHPRSERELEQWRSMDGLMNGLARAVDGLPEQWQLALGATATRAAQVASKLNVTNPVGPLVEAPPLGGSSKSKYGRDIQSFNNPLTVLDHLAAGTLLPDHVEALKTTYPAVYRDVVGAVMEQAVERRSRGKPVPRKIRSMIELLAGTSLGGVAGDADIWLTQRVFQASEQGQSQQGAARSGKKTRTKKLAEQEAKRTETNPQQMEGRRVEK